MNNILNKICSEKIKEVEFQRRKVTEKELLLLINNTEKPRKFKNRIDENFSKGKVSVIAEIKKASPSKGLISKNFDPEKIAEKYTIGDATCISVLTDKKYFLGQLNDLVLVKKKSKAPILRKDFIVSEYQILESRAYGADCILLINGVLDIKLMKEYVQIARELGMDVLIETHTNKELQLWMNNDKILLGINNRNLKNMKVDIKHSVKLKNQIKKNINIVCESGIGSEQDINYLLNNKFTTFLIGEYLMNSNNPDELLINILNKKTTL